MNIDFSEIPSPCFVLDESLLRRNLELINRVQQEAGVKIILALKGFAMYGAFPMVRQYLAGTTASSLHEARLGFEEFGGEVHAYCPAYPEQDFDELLGYCGHISFNSLSQWERFRARVQGHKRTISPGLRINPEYSTVTTDLYNPCVPGSRLGIRAEQLGDTLPPGIAGLHFHNLCESTSYDLEKTLESVERLFGKYLHQVSWLNMGGGHLMTARKYDVEHLIPLLRNFRNRYPHLQIIMEPGSAVAWETGYLLASVLDIIESKGVQVAMLDVSIAAHMPDCLEMPYKPRILNASDPVPGKPTYRMGGLTCLAGDFIGDYSFENELQVGDRIIFDDMIHYTMVKTTTFNGVNLPSIGIWREEGRFDLLRTFGYQDFKGRLS